MKQAKEEVGRPREAGERGRGGELLRAGGRVAVWAVLAIVFARGLAGVIVGPQRVAPRTVPPAPAGAGFPDAEADAFAVDFAREYLSVPARGRAGWARLVAPFLVSGLSDRAAAALPRRSPGQQVAQATVARAVSLGGARALITVACNFTDPARPARYLVVPVARGAAGGLVVFDLPALSAPPPPAGDVSFSDPPPLTGPSAAEIQDLVGRFLGAYLAAQDPSGLAYFLAPGAAVPPIGAGLSLVSLDAVGQQREPTTTDAAVLAAVHVRDAQSGAVYPLRYRLGLVHRDRWYVSSLAGGPSA